MYNYKYMTYQFVHLNPVILATLKNKYNFFGLHLF